MKVRVYATLKDYFEPEFELDGSFRNTDDLMTGLLAINRQAASVLAHCRFAVDEDFVGPEYKIQPNDTVIIIPPGSGG